MSDALPPRPDDSTGGIPPRPTPPVPPPPVPSSTFSDDNPDDFAPPTSATYFTPEEPKKNGNKALIIGGGVLAVAAIGAGVAFAVNKVVPSDDYAYNALPADGAFVYGEVNMDPSVSQKKSWLLLSKKLSSDDSTKSMRELVAEELGDFTKVDPWFGDRAAAVGYADLGGDGLPDAFYAYQIKDADAAAAFSKSYGEPNKIVGNYFLTTNSPEGQAVLDALAAKGGDSLGAHETFKKDLDSVGAQNIAHGWLDLGPALKNGNALADDVLAASPLSDVAGQIAPPQDEASMPEVTGRLVISAKVNDNGIEGKAIMRDVTVDGVKATDATNFSSVEKEFKNLPKGLAHMSVAGLDESLKTAWTEALNSNDATVTDGLTQVKDAAAQFGIVLPEEFKKVVGTTTSLSIMNSANDLGLFAHMVGADAQAWASLGAATGITGGDPASSAVISPTEDGVSVTYGNAAGDKVESDKAFMDALVDLNSAGAAFLIDLDATSALLSTMNMGTEDMSTDEPLGVLGVTVGADGSDIVVNGKWVLR